MKKLFTLIVISCFAGIAIQSLGAQEADYATLQQAMTAATVGPGSDYAALGAISMKLSPMQRLSVVEAGKSANRDKCMIGMGLNFLLPYGIGEYIIGDVGGGLLLTALDLGSSVASVAFLYWYYNTFSTVLAGSYYSSEADALVAYDEIMTTLYTYIGVTFAISTVSLIVRIAAPLIYMNGANARLSRAVELGGMSITPVLDMDLAMSRKEFVPEVKAGFRFAL